MAIHGFVLEEDTKPAHERHLQALKVSSQACFLLHDKYSLTHRFYKIFSIRAKINFNIAAL
jgi:hypothetical protein